MPKYINPHRMFTGVFTPDPVFYLDISPIAKLLYGRLMRYSGTKGVAYPSQKTLCKEFNASERSIQRWTKELVDHKLIEIHYRGLGKTNQYRFLNHEIFYVDLSEDDDTSAESDDGSGVYDPPTLATRRESLKESHLREPLEEPDQSLQESASASEETPSPLQNSDNPETPLCDHGPGKVCDECRSPHVPYLGHSNLKKAIQSACRELGIPTTSQFQQQAMQQLTKRDKWFASQGQQSEFREHLAVAMADYAADSSVGSLMQALSQASRSFQGDSSPRQWDSNTKRSTASKTPLNGKSYSRLDPPTLSDSDKQRSPTQDKIAKMFEAKGLHLPSNIPEWKWGPIEGRVAKVGKYAMREYEQFISEVEDVSGQGLFEALYQSAQKKLPHDDINVYKSNEYWNEVRKSRKRGVNQ